MTRTMSSKWALTVLASLGCTGSTATCENVPEDDNPSCPIDACTDECGVEDRLACCIASHGRGLTSEEYATVEERCSAVSCDPETFLSNQAALCSAQAQGLPLLCRALLNANEFVYVY